MADEESKEYGVRRYDGPGEGTFILRLVVFFGQNLVVEQEIV